MLYTTARAPHRELRQAFAACSSVLMTLILLGGVLYSTAQSVDDTVCHLVPSQRARYSARLQEPTRRPPIRIYTSNTPRSVYLLRIVLIVGGDAIDDPGVSNASAHSGVSLMPP